MARLPIVAISILLFSTAHAAPWRVKAKVVHAERASNTFRSIFEREIRDYGWTKLKSAANTKLLVRRLDESLEALRVEVDDRRPMRGRDRMVAVVARGRAVDEAFRANPEIAGSTRPRWGRLRSEINALAKIYELKPITRR